jgi:type IV pilus assembly protein PilF
MNRFIPRLALSLSFLALAACNTQPPRNVGESVSQQTETAGSSRSRAKIHTELASLYLQDGNMAVALEETRIALASDTSYAPAYNMRALIQAYLHEYQSADEDFQRAISIAPDDPEINNNYGWFLCQRGQSKQAFQYFTKAIKNPLYSTPDRAYLNAGSCAIKSGDYDAAEDYLLKALRISRNGAPLAHVQLGLLHYKRGNDSAALQEVQAAMHLMPRPSAEVVWLALRVERRVGDRNEERRYTEILKQDFPASPEFQEFVKGNFE